MRKFGVFVMAAALASSAAVAQQTGESQRKPGTQGMPGVVTGGTVSGGIGLRSDVDKVHGNVPAVSGGVGLNARDALRSETPRHNVKMVFSLNTGNYLADVNVKVTDRSGRTVIDDMSNGPWLYAQLPPGSYTARATYNGHTVTQRFSVGRSGMRTAHFRWPASVEQQAVGVAAAEAGGQILGTGPQEMR